MPLIARKPNKNRKMTEIQKVLCKLSDFAYQEIDENNPHLELTLEEVKILLELTY